MQTATAVLEARSQAQALDWSLVLISQGIESVIARSESGVWILEVDDQDLRRAKESIAAYERENTTPWRREVKGTGLLFDTRAVFCFAALVLFYFFVATAPTDFKTLGMMDRGAVLRGEWWRVFTAMTLHADMAHLAMNAAVGFVFLGLAMGSFGSGVALLLSFLGGALGNVATFALHDGAFYSLGASGMVMASLGLLTAHSISLSRHEKRTVLIGRGVIAGCLLVVLLGFSAKSDVIAHVGGFIAGVVLGIATLRWRIVLMKLPASIVSIIVCVTIVILTWALALR